ncbi:MAG: glycosyltransferase family 2 protein [Gammaproteobacteria bacterium]
MSTFAHRPLISVVIPSYNDREIILPYFTAISATLDGQDEFDYELIYVDDGSSDDSQQVLRELAAGQQRVTYVELMRNYGQQRALFAGLSESKGDYVVTLDGDYQYEPEVILQLVAALRSGFDLVSGVRKQRKDNIKDVLTSRWGNAVIKAVLGIDVADFGAVKAFSRALVERILVLRHYYSDVYPTAYALRPTITEVPVDHRERLSGTSHWNTWMRLRVYADIYMAYTDDQFQTPFKLGANLSLLGATGGSALTLYKAVLSHAMSFVEIWFATFVVVVLGISAMAWSLTMALLSRIYKQNISRQPYAVRAVYGAGEASIRTSDSTD